MRERRRREKGRRKQGEVVRAAWVCGRSEEEDLHDTGLVTASGISTVGRRMTAFSCPFSALVPD